MEKLTIYTKKGCPFCNKLKQVLDERSIDFIEYDINSKDLPRKVIDIDGHVPVPQVDINGKIIYDYSDEEELVDEIELMLNN